MRGALPVGKQAADPQRTGVPVQRRVGVIDDAGVRVALFVVEPQVQGQELAGFAPPSRLGALAGAAFEDADGLDVRGLRHQVNRRRTHRMQAELGEGGRVACERHRIA